VTSFAGATDGGDARNGARLLPSYHGEIRRTLVALDRRTAAGSKTLANADAIAPYKGVLHARARDHNVARATP
jgi:hypothetical protein